MTQFKINWNEVEGTLALDEAMDVLERFMVMTPFQRVATVLWASHTHALDAFGISPRLPISSAVPMCGKTTLLDLALLLSRRGEAVIAPSGPALFRAIDEDRPTFGIDEADKLQGQEGKADVESILLSGHRKRTAFVRRCGTEKDGTWRSVKFPTWAAVAVALNGRLTGALATRGIEIRLRRKRRDENTEKFLESNADQVLATGNRIGTWVARHSADLQTMRPATPEELTNRAADNWTPLLAIADLAGGRWSELARLAAVALSASTEPASLGERLLANLKEIFEDVRRTFVSTKEILHALNSREDWPWSEYKDGEPLNDHGLAACLKPFGVRSDKCKDHGDEIRGYYRGTLEEVWARYLDPHQSAPANPLVSNDFPGADFGGDTSAATCAMTNLVEPVDDPIEREAIQSEGSP